ncbi:MFS family permease [Brevibacillus nitrificans]|nr:MFS family permease [Brevibacillus nitrificans]
MEARYELCCGSCSTRRFTDVYPNGVGCLLNCVLAPTIGRLFDKHGPKAVITPGTILVAIGYVIYSMFGTDTALWMIVVTHMIMMLGIGMVLASVQTNILNSLPKQYYPDGIALTQTIQQVAVAIGIAVMVSILAAKQNSYLAAVANEPTQAVAAGLMLCCRCSSKSRNNHKEIVETPDFLTNGGKSGVLLWKAQKGSFTQSSVMYKMGCETYHHGEKGMDQDGSNEPLYRLGVFQARYSFGGSHCVHQRKRHAVYLGVSLFRKAAYDADLHFRGEKCAGNRSSRRL